MFRFIIDTTQLEDTFFPVRFRFTSGVDGEWTYRSLVAHLNDHGDWEVTSFRQAGVLHSGPRTAPDCTIHLAPGDRFRITLGAPSTPRGRLPNYIDVEYTGDTAPHGQPAFTVMKARWECDGFVTYCGAPVDAPGKLCRSCGGEAQAHYDDTTGGHLGW